MFHLSQMLHTVTVHRSLRYATLTMAVMMLISGAASAQDAGTSSAKDEKQTIPVPCTQEEAQAFDFWIGEWEVRTNSDGVLQGIDRIEKILDGCVLEQRWQQQNSNFQPQGSPNFLRGRSFTSYNPTPLGPAWNQIWVDNGGSFLHMAGDFKEGRMQLESIADLRQKWRIVWEPQKDGSILNYGLFSQDYGVTWTKYFDITYRKKKS